MENGSRTVEAQSVALQQRIDAVRNRFEESWKQGGRPVLEQFLALPKCVYDTVEELADAGWTVD